MLSVLIFSSSAFAEQWSSIETNGIPYMNPEGIYFDNSGGKWITGQDSDKGSVFLWSESGDHQYYNSSTTGGNLKNDVQVRDLLFDDNGATWFATWGDGLKIKKADGSWLSFNQNDDYERYIMSDEVLQIFDSGADGKWILTYQGAYLVTNDYEVAAGKSIILSDYHPACLFVDSNKHIWIGTEYGILTDSKSGSGSFDYVHNVYPGSDMPPADYSHCFSSISQDGEGNLWFGTSNYGTDGVYMLSADGEWTKYTASNSPFPSVSITDMEYDSSSGTVWMSTYYGDLIQALGSSIQSYSKEDLGITGGDSIFSLRLDSDGGIWLICHDFMSSIYKISLVGGDASGPYNINTTSTSLATYRIHDMEIDKDGGLWVAGDEGSVSRRTPEGDWIQYRDLGEYSVSGLAVDSNNVVYILPLKGPVMAYDVNSENWLEVPQPPEEIFYSYGTYVDSKDGKWFYTSDGIYYLSPDNSSWEIYTSSSTTGAIPSDMINCAYEDGEGNIWIGTREGAARMSEDGSWEGFYSGESNFMGGDITSFVENDLGELYAIGSYGVQMYSPDGWTDVSHTDFPAGKALKMSNGDIWAGTTLLKNDGGKTVYDHDSTGGILPESSYLGGILKSSAYDQDGTVYFAYMYDGIKLVSGLEWPSSEDRKYTPWSPAASSPVDTDYKWSISLSKPADDSTVNDSSIFVCKKGSSARHSVSVSLNPSDSSIIEITPLTLYDSSEEYVIYIGDSIKNVDGENLSKAIRFEFQTK